MSKFIYVFDTAAKDILERAGFLLLKEDNQNSTFVFAMDGRLGFIENQDAFSYIMSDTLSF